MIKKYIIVIVAVAFAIWIGFFFMNKAAVAPEAPVNGGTEQATTTPVSIAKTSGATDVSKTTTSAPVILKDGSYLVSYTNRGFSPSTLTIKAGKSVHFVNNSSKAMSLTTTDTTNSQVFAEFNQGKTVGQGGFYDFTFLSVGTWGYMNRNNAIDKGTIIVQ